MNTIKNRMPSRTCASASEPRAGAEPTEMDSGEQPGPGRRRRIPPPGRRPLPEALPRQRVEIDLPEADKICVCGHRKTRIGEAVTEKLEYVPASLRVIETARLKYACPHCHEGVVEARRRPRRLKNRWRGMGCSRPLQSLWVIRTNLTIIHTSG